VNEISAELNLVRRNDPNSNPSPSPNLNLKLTLWKQKVIVLSDRKWFRSDGSAFWRAVFYADTSFLHHSKQENTRTNQFDYISLKQSLHTAGRCFVESMYWWEKTSQLLIWVAGWARDRHFDYVFVRRTCVSGLPSEHPPTALHGRGVFGARRPRRAP